MKSKAKRITLTILALCLVAAITIGGTLAYLTRETERRANNFTFSGAGDGKALNAMLTEPEWDGVIDYEYAENGTITPIYDYIDHDNNAETPNVPVYGYDGGDLDLPITDKANLDADSDRARFSTTDNTFEPVYGDESAQNMIPGASALKNPVITNTGLVCDAWVAAKITFVYGENHPTKAGQPLNSLDLAALMDVITIDFNTDTTDNWERIGAGATAADLSQTFYYKETLAKTAANAAPGVYGDVTDPIFNSVSVKPGATTEQIAALEAINGFAIWIEGFAAQSDVAEDYAAFKTWGTTGVVFSNTPTESAPANVAKPGIIPANQ